MERTPGDLPSGIVTFVFTDIEGSTRLVGRLGDRYRSVVERHREILRTAWVAHGGHEVYTEGDGSLVAFSEASQALQACVEAQRALLAEDWLDGGEVRVRMGIHTGLAIPYHGDYLALAVNQASRVVSAAHGGQILVSEQATTAAGSTCESRLRRVGRFRLRDFDGPELLYQVVSEGLPTEFPAVRAVPAERHNLVQPADDTIGREELIARLVRELTAGRLLTLVGPGGVGKSRVAGEVGMRVASDWQDGVWRVDFSSVAEPSLAASAIAKAVGVEATPDKDCWVVLRDHLADKQAIVMFDNCEHLAAACGKLAESLIKSCRGVAVLATSRVPLHAAGESLWPIPPLSLPSPVTNGTWEYAAAMKLFLARGRAVRPDFDIDEANAGTVAEICRRLDGIPLAIELAAANLAVQSPADILQGLEDRFRILRRRNHGGGRHEAMDRALEWSHRLLDDVEQKAFRRLSVFGGSFSIDTASAAVSLGVIPPSDVAPLVWSLADRSLINVELAADATRYSMFETIRAYGRERLDETAETGKVAERVAEHLLERLGPWHPVDVLWRDGVDEEIDNLRAVIPILAEVEPETAQILACTIGRYHDASFSFFAGIEEVGRYVEALTEPNATRAALVATLAFLYLRTGDTASAARLVEDADRIRARHGLPAWDDACVDRARGEIARREGKLQEAVEIARHALERELSARGQSRMYNLWGTTAGAMGDMDTAKAALSRELELSIEVGYEGYIASAYGNLAEVSLRLGERTAAAHNQRRCLALAAAQGSLPMVAFSLIVAARLAGADGEWEAATRLHAKGEALLSEVGLALYDDDRRESDQLMAGALRTLGEEAFDDATRRGRGLTTPEAIAEADTMLAAGEELIDRHTVTT